jgi:SAM-dependent methyltransferase
LAVNIDPDLDGAENGVMRCQPSALPFATNSIDVMVLPHILEFEQDPHEVLREVERVLIGEGHVVVIGFNPIGTWGLFRVALTLRNEPPWSGRFYRLGRVADWLHVLGFDITASKYFFFHTPLHTSTFIPDVLFEKQSAYRWPYCGGAYILVAKKRVVTLTPILKLRRKHRKILAGSVIKPLTRNLHDN